MIKKMVACAVWCLFSAVVVNGSENKPKPIHSLDQLHTEVSRIRDKHQQRTADVWKEVLVRGNRIDHGPSDQIKININDIEKK